jgi:hypothetical protein
MLSTNLLAVTTSLASNDCIAKLLPSSCSLCAFCLFSSFRRLLSFDDGIEQLQLPGEDDHNRELIT